MEANLEELLTKVTNLIEHQVKTETIIGKEFKLGTFTCVPVIRVSLGFGSGGAGGEDKSRLKGESAGAGAGLNLTPVGFLVTHDDQISFVGTQQSKGLNKVFEKVPELIEDFMNERGKKKEKKEEPEVKK